MVYWSIEPPAADRIEFAIAQLTALTANLHRDSKKREEPFIPQDFIPKWGRDPEPEQDEEDGMSPEHVMGVLERMMEHQERREKLVAKRGNGRSVP